MDSKMPVSEISVDFDITPFFISASPINLKANLEWIRPYVIDDKIMETA